jgi:hypothetical protein
MQLDVSPDEPPPPAAAPTPPQHLQKPQQPQQPQAQAQPRPQATAQAAPRQPQASQAAAAAAARPPPPPQRQAAAPHSKRQQQAQQQVQVRRQQFAPGDAREAVLQQLSQALLQPISKSKKWVDGLPLTHSPPTAPPPLPCPPPHPAATATISNPCTAHCNRLPRLDRAGAAPSPLPSASSCSSRQSTSWLRPARPQGRASLARPRRYNGQLSPHMVNLGGHLFLDPEKSLASTMRALHVVKQVRGPAPGAWGCAAHSAARRGPRPATRRLRGEGGRGGVPVSPALSGPIPGTAAPTCSPGRVGQAHPWLSRPGCRNAHHRPPHPPPLPPCLPAPPPLSAGAQGGRARVRGQQQPTHAPAHARGGGLLHQLQRAPPRPPVLHLFPLRAAWVTAAVGASRPVPLRHPPPLAHLPPA